MANLEVRNWEGHGDLTVVEVERVGSPLDTRELESEAGVLCLLLSQGYFRQGRFVARHYFTDFDLTELGEDPPRVAC